MATYANSTPAPEDGAHHRTRRAVEAHIEWLIALLDDLDDDPDLEDDGTAEEEPDAEPSIGWPESFGRTPISCHRLMYYDTGEEEHTAPERAGRGYPYRIAPDDAEDTHDAEAMDEDGSETGPSDNGIADAGGAAEQFFGFVHGNVEMTRDMPGGDVIGADEGRGGVR
ncbi:hypothetical protein [Enterovirga sp.]|uniref:hypothetical protein n=1 Tax=Enterovirga sp. TaxID=2026350 RepID=UPI002CEEE911|nr:hypothetical protein [Enterovirga sp.]HMO28596.1 hypothetical protein [Enterovirga sp.]